MFNSDLDEEKIYRIIDYRFKDKNLLLQALTRQSALNEGIQLRSLKNFQQLEFIGDRILDLVIGDILLEHNPDANEGELTIKASMYVNNNGPLATVARKLKLNKFMIIGYGEETHNNVRNNNKVLSDAMEALLGALWLDSSRDYVFLKKFITKHWECVGLPQPLRLFDLQKFMVSYYYTPLPERIQQLKACFKKPISQKTINAFLAGDAFEDEAEVLNLILSLKPDQSAIDNALINAIFFGCDTQIAILLKHGANPNTIYPPDNWKHWKDHGLDNEIQFQERTASTLHIAISRCSVKTIELLLGYGADPNWNQGVSTKRIYSPCNLIKTVINDTLDIALPEFPELAEELSQTIFSNFTGESSQSFAYSEAVSIFSHRRKPKRVEKFDNKFTALHEVVICYSSDIREKIQLLKKWGADLNATDYEGDTPLHIVARDDTHDIYDFLIDFGANPHIKNNKGKTPQEIKQALEYNSSDEDFLFDYNINKINF